MLVSANDILLNRLLHNGWIWNIRKNIQEFTFFFLSTITHLPAAYVPIVGIWRRIASPSLVKTFRFRISHRVTLRRGRYAAFWSCRRRFRTGIIVYRPSDPFRQKWILKNRNRVRALISPFYALIPGDEMSSTLLQSLQTGHVALLIKMQIRFSWFFGRVSMHMNEREEKSPWQIVKSRQHR